MKKISFIAAAALAVMMTGCGNGTPKANLKSDVDSLYYCIGIAQSYGLKTYLANQVGIDTTNMDEFFRGFNEGMKEAQENKNKAYYIGLQIGQQMSNQMIAGLNRELFGDDSTKYVSADNFVAGFITGAIGKDTTISVEDADMYAKTHITAIKARQMEESYGPNKKAGEDFMAEIAKKDGVKQLEESGVYYEVLTEGAGKIPADTSLVKVKYEGTLIDGTVFDGNMDAENPITFRCNGVIPGWTMALTHMPAGSKWKVYIPQDMAYGDREAGDKIKPFSALVFTIDLISVE